MSFASFTESRQGEMIAPLLRDPGVIAKMEALSKEGRPAVAALDQALPQQMELSNTERQYVGRWIRDTLAVRGWRGARQRRFAGGRIFTSGTVYTRPKLAMALASPATAASLQPLVQRVATAQAMVRAFSTNSYGVDDFLRDKRAEAEREERDDR